MATMWLGFAIGVVVTAVLIGVVLIARAGNLGRASWGLTVAGRAGQDPTLEAKVNELLGSIAVVQPAPRIDSPKPAASTSPAKPSGEVLRLLTLLQSEARLLDFLMEDISGAAPEQIGDAVKEIHTKAQRALKQHLVLEEIYPASAETVTVAKGFDPSAVRVVGNVIGEPPFTGRLEHPGWKVKEVKLPAQAPGQDPFVIHPAEVEVA